jgi:glycosyltransferase involved in cell wall biosynthesis
MHKRIMIIMVLSALDGRRSLGGVDSACQMHLQGLAEIVNDKNRYVIVAFNPANDLEQDKCRSEIAPNIHLLWYNYARKTDRLSKLPNVVRNELLLRKLIKTFQPDIVHSHLPQWHIRKWAGEKKVLTLHQYHNIGRTPVNLFNDLLHRDIIEPASIRNSDRVTCVSRDVISALGRRRNGAIHYVPNAVNPRYMSLKRQAVRIRDGRINLLMAGTLCRAKGTMNAVEIVRRLKAEHPGIRLTLAGKFGSDEEFNRRLLSFIDDHTLQDNVHIAGVLNVAEMAKCMENTHIGLSLSEQETFGLAGLECLAAGIPLVTTETGVFKWQAEDFTSRGVDIVGVGDVDAATRAVSNRIQAKAYEATSGIREFLIENFSQRSCAAKYHEMYDAV